MYSREHALAFLRLLHPWVSADYVVEFRLLHGRDSHSLWYWTDSGGSLNRVLELSSTGLAAYVGVNPRRTMADGKLENIAAVTAVPIDIDWAKTGLRPDSVQCALRKIGLHESMVVVSGGGAHIYLLLDRPYTVAEAKPVIARVIECFQGDSTTKAPTQIMRLPGTVNWKEPHTLCYLHSAPGHRYTLQQITAALDAVGAPQALEEQPPAPAPLEPTEDIATLIGRLPERFQWMCQTGMAPAGTDISTHVDFPIACRLVELEATDQQISDVICRIYRPKGRTTSYVQRTIERARRTVVRTNPLDWVVSSGGLYYVAEGRVKLDRDKARELINRAMPATLN